MDRFGMGGIARGAVLAGIVLALGACAAADDEATAEASSALDEGAAVESDPAAPAAPLAESEAAGVAASGADAFAAPEAAAGCTITVNSGAELVIRALGVVEDAARTRWTGSTTDAKDGAWTFGKLMTQMAGANDPRDFVRTWLSRWETARTVNGFSVPARTPIRDVINAWPKDAAGKLDLRRSPMRLLAIVNRMDLRQLSAGNAGEGRFVFGVTDASGRPLSFTVILEYKLPAATLAEAQAWARQWHALGTLTPGSAAYNDALQKVTDRFARRGASPTRPNGSAIGQVRTNEIAIGSPWELREFRLNTAGQLVQSTVAQTPASSFKNSARTARFINANEARVLAGKHTVPLTFESAPFRGGNSLADFVTWNPPGVTNPNARHAFAVNTCDGCHSAETQTGFLHVGVRSAGQVAPLSGFMTGISVPDPVTGTTRRFADIARRRVDFANFLCGATTSAEPASARVH